MAGPVIYIGPVALEFHMKVGAPAFAKFRDLIRLTAIEVYGEPSAHLLKQLEEKARMLGGGAVSVHELQGGLSRLG